MVEEGQAAERAANENDGLYECEEDAGGLLDDLLGGGALAIRLRHALRRLVCSGHAVWRALQNLTVLSLYLPCVCYLWQGRARRSTTRRRTQWLKRCPRTASPSTNASKVNGPRSQVLRQAETIQLLGNRSGTEMPVQFVHMMTMAVRWCVAKRRWACWIRVSPGLLERVALKTEGGLRTRL